MGAWSLTGLRNTGHRVISLMAAVFYPESFKDIQQLPAADNGTVSAAGDFTITDSGKDWTMYQYRIRGALFVILLLSTASIGWRNYVYEPYQSELRISELLQGYGATIDWGVPEGTGLDFLVPRKYRQRIMGVSCGGSDFAKHFHILGCCRHLQRLSANYCPLRGQLDVLNRCPNLQKVELVVCDLTDNDLRDLARCKSLQSLNFTFNELTDGAAEHLGELAELEKITLDHTSISDETVKALVRNPKLSLISLRSTQVTDEAIDALASARGLQIVNFLKHIRWQGGIPGEFTLVSETGVNSLRTLRPDLRILWGPGRKNASSAKSEAESWFGGKRSQEAVHE